MTNVSLALPACLPACAAPLEQKEYLDSIIVVPLVVALPLIKAKSHARRSAEIRCARVITVAGPFFANSPLRSYGAERCNSLLQL
jgi:hypothetical protein